MTEKSYVREGRKCAGNTLRCGAFEMLLGNVASQLLEGRISGTEPEDISSRTIGNWNLIVMGGSAYPELVALEDPEFRRAVFEEDYKHEEVCPSIDVTDVELPQLRDRFPDGHPDCTGLSDRLRRISLVKPPEAKPPIAKLPD